MSLLLSLVCILSLCGFSSNAAADLPIGASDVGSSSNAPAFSLYAMDTGQPVLMAESSDVSLFSALRLRSYDGVRTDFPLSGGIATVPDGYVGSYTLYYVLNSSPFYLDKGSYMLSFSTKMPSSVDFSTCYIEFTRSDAPGMYYRVSSSVTNFLGTKSVTVYFDLPCSARMTAIYFSNGMAEQDNQNYSGTYEILDAQLPVLDTDNKGFLEGLLAWIKSIYDGILGLPEKIKGFLAAPLDAIKQAVNAVATSIIDGLKSLFIPDEGYFDGLFDRLNTFFSERFGFLYYPIEHFISWCNRLLTLQDAAPYVTIPELSFEGEVFIPAMTYTFDFLDEDPWSTVHDYYLMAMDVAMIMAFVHLLQRKYEEVMGK